MKIGYVFSGQGAQYVGMGKDFHDKYESSRRVFDSANENLGFDLKNIIFDGTQEELNMTEITQPAILTATIAMLQAVNEELNIKPEMVAGLSLGEYSAHVCSETIEFGDAVKLVSKRGKHMQDAVPVGVGGMTAIVGLKAEEVDAICKNSKSFGDVEVSNYNSPKQIVIGGSMDGLAKAGELAKEAGAKRIISLPVSAPFHTSLLENARVNMKKELAEIKFADMKTPIITNVHGEELDCYTKIPGLLADQVTNPVKWVDTIDTFAKNDVDTIIEIGPGKALSGFIKKTNRGIRTFSVQNVEGLKEVSEFLLKEAQ